MQKIILHDVGMRDGLQVEDKTVPLEHKIKWLSTLLTSGLDIIQVGSFVNPAKVPQMADTDRLFGEFTQAGKKPGNVLLSGLVLNEKGLERAMACGVEMFCMGVSASETHSRKNTGMGIDEALGKIIAMTRKVMETKKHLQVSVQSAFGCGFEGVVPESRVLDIVRRYVDAGIRNISLADTAGHANPAQVERLFAAIARLDDQLACACHFHNTYGLGLANCYAALRAGVQYFESSFGGLGGCPFTAVASGNVCTEDLLHFFHCMNLRQDIRLTPIIETSKQASVFFGRDLPGVIYKTGPIPGLTKGEEKGAEAGSTACQTETTPKKNMRKLLAGVRVLDLTNVLSGPFATLHLALCGAEVIKIENPQDGDLARKLGNVSALNSQLMGTSFLAQNANKKSLTLNLKKSEAKEIFRKLVKNADVVVENFRPDVMERLGLSYEKLREINPKLIYCAISGFGQTGPDALKPAYDQIIQGLSGIMAINGDERLNPLRCGFPVCDTVGGVNAAFAVMGALYYRERTGEGQFIDIALLDSIMPFMGWVAANLLIGKQQPQLLGNDNFTAAPSGTFATRDGYINIAANKQEQWEAMADLLGLSHLKSDPRFQERDTRKKNRRSLTPLLEEKLKENTTDHWVTLLNQQGVPSGAILGLEEALAAPQVTHRDTIRTVAVEGIGEVQVFNMTAKFEKAATGVETPPPKLSAHSEEILITLGYSKEDVARLKKEGIV
jgi:formyl-CoA transferase